MSRLYLRDPTLSSVLNSSQSEDQKEAYFLQEQTELNLLLIGTKEGMVHVRIFGCFTCCILDMCEYLGISCSVEALRVSEDLRRIYVVTKDENSLVQIVTVNSSIFKTHAKELFAVAMKYVKLMDLITYLRNTIASITETWESFLLEIDHKLSKYAKKVPEGGITADFLDLLIFGICASELQEFLMHDLTKKGLEKFGQTIEMSYTNIQKLLLKNINKYGQNVTFQLAELRGMGRFDCKYEIVGLSDEKIAQAIQSCGAFLIKAAEIQQIINNSVINYKAFFRWLYGAILTLMDENVPGEIHRMTQQDVAYITEFLQNFDRVGGKDGGGFVMEQLGQYLADEPLSAEPTNEDPDSWEAFLEENACLESHSAILKRAAGTSLVQQFKNVALKVASIFTTPRTRLQGYFRMMERETLDIYQCDPTVTLRVTSVNASGDEVIFAFADQSPHEESCVLLVQFGRCTDGVSGVRVNFSPRRVIDLQFYSSAILSVLLEDVSSSTALLLQMTVATCGLKNLKGVGPLTVSAPSANQDDVPVAKDIKMPAAALGVSGSRRVGAILADNRRKVKLFEMEADEEDDEDVSGVLMTDTSLPKDVDMPKETTSAD
ncbi:unnamed protein product [Acanthoscelides obtectus]|nr:unnamed protein product [Acanthoscelides obtectus]CAK1624112.1 Anaphase-promoting complex subunit 4 [Acanthoscelides obtectus]